MLDVIAIHEAYENGSKAKVEEMLRLDPVVEKFRWDEEDLEIFCIDNCYLKMSNIRN
jgi:hypothetical protein